MINYCLDWLYFRNKFVKEKCVKLGMIILLILKGVE